MPQCENPDLLRELADNLQQHLQRCYGMARATLDLQVREKLLELAQEFEVRAEDARSEARRCGQRPG